MQRYGLGIMVVWWTLMRVVLAAEPPPLWGERFEEIVGHDGPGEAVIRSHLELLIAYLQAIQQ